MSQQKGFVLIEVLVSMCLITMVIFFLLHQQRVQKQLLLELQGMTKASQFLNQRAELQLAKQALPKPPFPYHLKQGKKHFGLYWGTYAVVRVL